MIPYMDLRDPHTVEIGIVDGDEVLYSRLMPWGGQDELIIVMNFYKRLKDADLDISYVAELILEAS